MSSRNLINTYRAFPKELFRINNGPHVFLRPWSAQERPKRFDIYVEQDLVFPKALNASTYKAPNGASMRPNSPYQHHLVNTFTGRNTLIFAVRKGIDLPNTLLLVHERADHWSLQPAVEMTLDDLNEELTSFLTQNSTVLSLREWKKLYPKPTSNLRHVGDFSAATAR